MQPVRVEGEGAVLAIAGLDQGLKPLGVPALDARLVKAGLDGGPQPCFGERMVKPVDMRIEPIPLGIDKLLAEREQPLGERVGRAMGRRLAKLEPQRVLPGEAVHKVLRSGDDEADHIRREAETMDGVAGRADQQRTILAPFHVVQP